MILLDSLIIFVLMSSIPGLLVLSKSLIKTSISSDYIGLKVNEQLQLILFGSELLEQCMSSSEIGLI